MPVGRMPRNKSKAPPFHPDSPSSVGSPHKDGLRKRTVVQRTPRKLCTLVLPPPLASSIDDAGDVVADDVVAIHPTTTTTTTTVEGGATPSSSHPRYSSSGVSVVSTSIASVDHVHVPRHLRVGMATCDPISAFGGRFALVGTCDGRIAIFGIFDFDPPRSSSRCGGGGISEDVLESERRRRSEWMEEEGEEEEGEGEEEDGTAKGRFGDRGGTTRADAHANAYPSARDGEAEEREWDARERMRRIEDARRGVDPMLVVSLPRRAGGGGDAYAAVGDGKIAPSGIVAAAAPPVIVAMCATPPRGGGGCAASLIETRDVVDLAPSYSADGRSEAVVVPPSCPDDGRLIGHVAVLTSDGDVHVIEFRDQPSSRSSDNSHGSDGGDARAEVLHVDRAPHVDFALSFNTSHSEATCICMYPFPVPDDGGGRCHRPDPTRSPRIPSMRLCIGHRSGILAAYRLFSLRTYFGTSPKGASLLVKNAHRRSPTANGTAAYITDVEAADFHNGRSNVVNPRILFQNDSIPLQRTRSEPIAASDAVHQSGMPTVSPAKAELCWMGRFDVPVRSLSNSGGGWLGDEDAQIALVVVGTECPENAIHQVCMNGLGPPVSHHSLSPALSLEVLNATLAESLWLIKSTQANKDDNKYINLHDCGVWPSPGEEIKDGWLRGSSRKGVDPRDKLFGTLGLRRTSITSKICCFEGHDPCFASAASDGTVAVSHVHVEDGSWGVTDEDNQIMLFERCIGMGTLDFEDDLSSKDSLENSLFVAGRYVACCLRAGTILLVPVAKKGTVKQKKKTTGNLLVMFAAPVAPNGDDDGVVPYVNSFTAGIFQVMYWNARLGKENYNTKRIMAEVDTKPIAIVGYQGGVLDVYETFPGTM